MSRPTADIDNEIILHGRRDNRSWFEPGIAVVPGRSPDGLPEIFVMAKLLAGNDLGPQLFTRTGDLGRTWTPPALSRNWHKIARPDGLFEEPWFSPVYHHKTDRLLALGHTVFAQDEGGNESYLHKHEKRTSCPAGRFPGAAVSFWNPKIQDFDSWSWVIMPEGFHLGIYYAGQKYECPDGSILAPGYYYAGPDDPHEAPQGRITVLRVVLDGTDAKCVEHGSVFPAAGNQRLSEPSLVRVGDRYLMTVRHKLRGYVAESADGLRFGELRPWTFDDGTALGNAETQQHWLSHDDRLFLVYNRKSELNNGVFRGRAPLFMAEVDLESLRVLRRSERVVFPEKGARMGNFCVANVGPAESWIVTGEWCEGMFPNSKPGDRFYIHNDPQINHMRYIGDLLLARIKWKEFKCSGNS